MGEDWIFFQKINIWGEADSINRMGGRGQEILSYKQVIYLHKVESSLRNLQVIRVTKITSVLPTFQQGVDVYFVD